MNTKRIRPYHVLNLLSALIAIVINLLANALPFNGQTTAEISDRFQVYFVPAGYVFAIWGVVYLGWLAFVIYQWLPSQRDNPRLQRLGYLFPLSCLANSAWLFLWHYEYFVMTVLVMLVLLLSLIAIYLRLRIGLEPKPPLERWCVDLTFSIYLGWISVATIANVTAVLDYLGWNGWGLSPVTWTLVMLAVGVALAAAMGLARRDVAYLAVILWAFVGIAIRNGAAPVVAAGAWTASALVAALLGVAFWRGQGLLPQEV